tara:strand:+ start:4088 stop:4684 length:597 start_codon:yes stop_codon:yes gene_type:complete
MVFDNFYSDPDKVREYALGLEYNFNEGAFPGKRSSRQTNSPTHNMGVKNFFEELFNISLSGWDHPSQGVFQLNSTSDIPWVHSDADYINEKSIVRFAAMIYLNPIYPSESCGTSFYEHIKSGKRYNKDIDYGLSIYDNISSTENTIKYYDSAWKIYDKIEYSYNRLVIFDSLLFHRTSGYFGHDTNSMRMIQTFFISF